MPFYTKLVDTNGDIYFALFQRKLKKGTVLDNSGLAPNMKVVATKYVATRGKDYSIQGMK